jgi:hypothetical protein
VANSLFRLAADDEAMTENESLVPLGSMAAGEGEMTSVPSGALAGTHRAPAGT